MLRRSVLPMVLVVVGVAALSMATTWWATSRSEARERGAERAEPTAEPVDEPGMSLVLPTRSKADRPAPAGVVDVPERFAEPDDLTAEIQVRQGGGHGVVRKTVTRTADRVHVRFGAHREGAEWLFVRNEKDGRRLMGTRIDHEHRALVDYEESELRTAGLARGWADVVAFGVQPETFSHLEPTGRERAVAGIAFAEYRAPVGAGSHVQELWWSDASVAPLRLVTGAGKTDGEMVVRNIRREVDPELLRDPRLRFPTYSQADVADWREKVHDHGEQH